MAKRPTPWYGHDTGTVSGLDPWSDNGDWSDYGEPGAWGGTAETNPWNIPDPIGDFGQYSLGYGPEGTGPGLGPDALMPFNQPDLGGDPSGLGELFAGDSGYGLQFDPVATAGRSWRPTYQVTGPGAEGYHVSSEVPYSGFPWVGQPGAVSGPPSLPSTDLQPRPPASGIQSSEEIVRPTTDLPPDWIGEILATPESIPFQPQGYEDVSLIPVGQDPLSQLANAVQASMMTTGGVAPTPLAGGYRDSSGVWHVGIEETLQDILGAQGAGAEALSPLGEQVGETASEIIARGGQMPLDVRRRAMEIESARSPLDILRRAQLEQGQAQLADRGLLGQGPEADYMQRLEERLAPEYTRAAQLIELAEREREEQRFQSAMELSATTSSQQAALRENRLANAMQQASGMSQEQSRNLLNTVASVTERQQMMNDVAIQSLDRNMAWNQFLAEFGLERAQVLEQIQSGRLAAILPLIQQYLAGTTLAASGFVKS
jgi:hypothetical protein